MKRWVYSFNTTWEALRFADMLHRYGIGADHQYTLVRCRIGPDMTGTWWLKEMKEDVRLGGYAAHQVDAQGRWVSYGAP